MKYSTTTLFREYDPEICRWNSLDPKLKDFPSESPFSAMGNNPIMNTDVLGDITTGAMNTAAERIRWGYNSVINDNTEKLNKISDINSDQYKSISNSIQQARIELATFNQEYQKLYDNQNITYDYQPDISQNVSSSGHGAGLTTALNSNTILVRMYKQGLSGGWGDYFDIANMRHELEHCFQFENRMLNFIQDGNKYIPGNLYDLLDEVKAFDVMHIFGQGLGNGTIFQGQHYMLSDGDTPSFPTFNLENYYMNNYISISPHVINTEEIKIDGMDFYKQIFENKSITNTVPQTGSIINPINQ